MSMIAGDIVKATDIPEAINSVVQQQLADAKEGKVNKYISFGAKANIYNDLSEIYSQTKCQQNEICKASEVYKLIVDSMWQSCRLISVSWKQHKNQSSYARKYSAYGISSCPISSYADYSAVWPQSKKSGTEYMFPQQAAIISAAQIQNTLAAMKEYNMNNYAFVNKGKVNNCYSNCNHDCHGSSRSRR